MSSSSLRRTNPTRMIAVFGVHAVGVSLPLDIEIGNWASNEQFGGVATKMRVGLGWTTFSAEGGWEMPKRSEDGTRVMRIGRRGTQSVEKVKVV